MSFNPLPVNRVRAIAEITIGDNPDRAVVDTSRVRGGAFSVASLADRDLIPADLRKANITKCYVESTQTEYWLKGGIANSNWVVYTLASQNNNGGTGGTNNTTTVYVGGSVPSKANKGMKTLAVAIDGGKACAVAMAEKPLGYVSVIVGGTIHTVGEDKTKDCYFSGDNGQTARAFDAIVVGDFCFWNPSKAGFALLENQSIEFHYEVLNTAIPSNSSPATVTQAEQEFVFDTPQNVWIINHTNPDPHPEVVFTDMANELIIVDYQYVSATRIEVYFDELVAGKAFVG